MRKVLNKNILFGFVLGIIITSGISVMAINMYSSDKISYNGMDVKSALDDLYNETSKFGDEIISIAIWNGQVSPGGISLSLTSHPGYENFEVGKNLFFIPSGQGAQRNGGYDMSGYGDGFKMTYNKTTGILTMYSSNTMHTPGEYDCWSYNIGTLYLVTIG